MNRAILALSALLLLAPAASALDAPEADAASSFCDPSAGPFDPCLWDCARSLQNTCDAILNLGGAVWRCVNGGPC